MRAARSRVVAKTNSAIPVKPQEAAGDTGFAERYALVCQAVAEGIYEWDIERNALLPSARLIEIFGFEGNSLGADDWNGIVHPEDFPVYRAALRDCFRGATARLNCEYRVRHGNGTYRWIEDRALPIRDGAGRAIRLVGAISDITERKESEQALREALEQQTATAEILQVINSSPGALAPVFDAVLERAMRLCEAALGVLFRYDGGAMHLAASRGASAEATDVFRQWVPDAGSTMEEVVCGAALVHVADVVHTDAHRSGGESRLKLVELTGARTALWVALRKDDVLLGVVVIYRQEVRPFSDNQIALLQSFAAQAVIAMENARLITETREALEQQTATAEVLQVINSSPGDLAPVFDAILEQAMRRCEATFGELRTFDEGQFQTAATRGVPGPYAEYREQHASFGQPGGISARILEGERIAHILDLKDEEAYRAGHPNRRALVDLGGARTALLVALTKGAAVLGSIMIYRQEVRAFSDRQIALLENFAAQAVIAIENARLITETREALERQTATAEVLGVINSSPGDLRPVFEAMVERAMRLCAADEALMRTFDGERLHLAAIHGAPGEAETLRQLGPAQLSGMYEFLARGDSVSHVADVRETAAYQIPLGRARLDARHVRSWLGVALRKDGALLGVINVHRREVRPFTDKQIALLENFAAQAVIAMENARLLTETREALEKQTATAEILSVISSSPTDVQPTFEAIAARAAILCGADHAAVFRFDGALIHYGAMSGTSSVPEAEREPIREAFPLPPGRSSATTRAIDTRAVVHIPDTGADPEYVAGLRAFGTALSVPMLRDGVPLGAITVTGRRVERFSDAQIELLKTFADQAVIAIETVRLFTELNRRTRDLQESLEYQTATSDVLKVISGSSFDLQPVFDTIVATATRLCGSDGATITIRDGEVYRYVSAYARDDDDWANLRQRRTIVPGRETVHGRVALEGRVVHIADVTTDPDYAAPETVTAGRRTILGVPLLREGTVVGTISMGRSRVEPFADRQIELVRTFADQAVIAIENTRLLEELRESLEQQQAIAEILRVINRSPGELQPVFDAILEKAMALCDVAYGDLEFYDGKSFRAVATRGLTDSFDAQVRRGYPGDDNPATRPLIAGERVSHIANMADVDFSKVFAHQPVKDEGHHTLLCVPLRRDDALLGMIACARGEVRAFSEKEIALLENFAAQAVIAMDNARLLDEIRQHQAELRVTFDNMADGVVMFDADMRLAAWNRNFQEILELPDDFVTARPSYADYLRLLGGRGELGSEDVEAELARRLEAAQEELRFERTRPDGRVIEVRRNAVPGGGAVLIYSDVTERKRAETEIRAARDAAEAALGELRLAQANLIQAEKMASLGQLTAGIAHEIKNPLNFVNNFANLSVELLDELKETAAPALESLDKDLRADVDEVVGMLTGNLEKIAEHGRRADGIVKSMLEHSRGASGERRRVDLNALVEEALNLAYHGARAQDQNFNITLERDFSEGIAPVELVPQDLTRVFLNLMGNGFYAANKRRTAAGETKFRPVLRVTTRELGDAVEVAVRDNGTGIPPEIKDKLFQPFFTTKPTGEGTGLGLSISYDIVTQQHGGSIAVDSEVGEYTEFTVRLPRDPAAVGSAAGQA